VPACAAKAATDSIAPPVHCFNVMCPPENIKLKGLCPHGMSPIRSM
jgi:hypothetical protein